jgi:hypothetical protein
MMPGTKSEQTEPPERTANEPVQHLTFAEASERLNISPDAVRMRVHRGKLASIRANERTFVLWPQPEQAHELNTERTSSERRSDVQGDARLIESLQSEVAYLRSALDAEMEARRRADHLVAGLMDRLPELAATVEDAPRVAHREPTAHERREAFWHAPAGASEGLIARLQRLLGR